MVEAQDEPGLDRLSEDQMEAYAAADEQFDHLAVSLLSRGKFQHGLNQATLHHWLTDTDNRALFFAVRHRLNFSLIGNEEVTLAAIAFNGVVDNVESLGDHIKSAVGEALLQLTEEAAGEVAVSLCFFPQPIHPLAWALTNLDEQYQVREEIRIAGTGVAMERLMGLNSDLLRHMPTSSSTQATVSSRIWPMVIVERDLGDPDDLGSSVSVDFCAGEHDSELWGPLLSGMPTNIQVSPPLMLDVAASEALINHVLMSRNLLSNAHGLPEESWDEVQLVSIQDTTEGIVLHFQHQEAFVGTLRIEHPWFHVADEDVFDTLTDALIHRDRNPDAEEAPASAAPATRSLH